MTGSGPEELSVRGTHTGNVVVLSISRGGAERGSFEWTIQQDGTLAGRFVDGESRGTSVAKRVF